MSGLLLFLAAQAADFPRSYSVWVSADRGHCTFGVTDVGEDAKQLTEQLGSGYDKHLGIELLTRPDTPARCVTKGHRAVTRAGFSAVRVRPGTDKDRSPGIP